MRSQIRQVVRSLLRDRAFTLSTVATLGLGVGATLAVFAVVESVLLRPLPYPDADRVVVLNHHDTRTGITKEFVALGDVVDMIQRARSFDALGTYGTYQATVYGLGDPFRVAAMSASSAAFAALGVSMAQGRGFEPQDSREGAGQIAIISDRLWRERFSGDSATVGRSIRIGGDDLTIVGVAAPGWRYPPNAETDLIVSSVMPAAAPEQRRAWTPAIARLKPGISLDAAQAEVTSIAQQLEQEFPAQNAGTGYVLVPLRDFLVGNSKKALVFLFASVGVLMLIAWANVANLLFARSLGKQRETAVRVALGANRSRVAGQVFLETGIVALIGTAIGLPIAYWGARALVLLVPQTVGVIRPDDIRVNVPVVAMALGLTALATMIFGSAIVLRTRNDRLSSVLGAGLRSSFGVSAQRALSTVVAAEIALAVVLLFGAGLVLRSFSALLDVNPGFSPDNVARVNVALPADRYPTAESRQIVWRRAFEALRGIPGVQAAGTAAITPLQGNRWTHPLIRPDVPLAAGDRPPEVGWQIASEGYFTALQIPVVAGRTFNITDHPESPPVVVVSDALVKRHFPDGNAVGKRVQLGPDVTAEIVGVVGSIRRAALTDEASADMYLPFERNPSAQTTVFVKTTGDPAAIQSQLHRALREIEPGALISDPGSLESVAAASVAVPRLLLALLGVFAGVAVVLASIGIYGVTAYSVQQRSREIGMRIALGAQRADVYRLILRRGSMIWIVGAGLGLAGAVAASRLLSTMLYSTSALDPLVIVSAPFVLLVVTLGACLIPARRAAALDPKTTLSE